MTSRKVEYIDALFEHKMAELTSALFQQMEQSKKLDKAIREDLASLGYDGSEML